MTLKTKEVAAVGCVGWIFVVLIQMIIGAWLWTYAVNTGFALAGSTNHIEWYHGALMGICPVIGGFSVPAAIITCVINAAVN
jgi:hypothetical protein